MVMAPSMGAVRGLTGFGRGLAAAGLTTAAGLAAERLSRDRRLALALDEERGARYGVYEVNPDETLEVRATDGATLHVEIDRPRGEASPPPTPGERLPTIIFTHGYCLSARCWVFQRRMLREVGYPLVLWDLRGHGRSDVGEPHSYTIDQVGADLAAVIEAAVPEGPIVLVGHSMGGMAMMSLGLHRPDLVRDRVIGAAFVATSTGGLSSLTFGVGMLPGRAVWKVGPTVTKRLAGSQHQVDSVVRAGRDVLNFLTNWGSFASPVPMSLVDFSSSMLYSTRLDVVSAFIPRLNAHDKAEALAAYHGLETLVLNGTDDRLTPPEHSDAIVRLLPGSEHVVVDLAGHLIMLEHPAMLNEHLVDLIARSRRATRVIAGVT